MDKITEAELIQVATELPAAPRLTVELGQAIRNPRVDSREITVLLRQDPAVALDVERHLLPGVAALHHDDVHDQRGALEHAPRRVDARDLHIVREMFATNTDRKHRHALRLELAQ